MANHQPDPSGFSPLPEQFQPPVIHTSPTQQLAKNALQAGNRHYYRYLSYHKAEDLKQATAYFQETIEKDSCCAQAYVRLALCLWVQDRIHLSQAFEYCQTALAQDPHCADAYLASGYFLKESGNFREAVAQFHRAIQEQPLRSTKARVALSHSLLYQSTTAQQLSVSQKLRLTGYACYQLLVGMAILPFDPETFAPLLKALTRDCQVNSVFLAAKWLEACCQQERLTALYEWAARKLPQEVIFHCLLAERFMAENQPEKAIDCYRQALRLEPQQVAFRRQLAEAYFACQQWEKAAEQFAVVIRKFPKDFEAQYHLGMIYSAQGHTIKALYHLKLALKQQPTNAFVHQQMAEALIKLDDAEGAAVEYELAVHYGEETLWIAQVAKTLGDLYFQTLGDLDKAEEAFQLANHLQAQNPEYLIALGDLYFEQGNFQEALQLYQQCQVLDPTNVAYHNHLGYLLWQMDRNEEAIVCYRQALQYDPANYIAYNNLGVIYLDEIFNAREAQNLFLQAVNYKADYTLAVFNLGRAQEHLGNKVQAALSYKNALALNTANPELSHRDILERINSLFED